MLGPRVSTIPRKSAAWNGITSLVCTLALPIRVMQGSLQSIFQHSCWAFGKNLGLIHPKLSYIYYAYIYTNVLFNV